MFLHSKPDRNHSAADAFGSDCWVFEESIHIQRESIMAPSWHPGVAVGDLVSRVTRLELDLGLDVRLHAMQSASCLGES